jgi:ferritin-like metal-binding protein YciE
MGKILLFASLCEVAQADQIVIAPGGNFATQKAVAGPASTHTNSGDDQMAEKQLDDLFLDTLKDIYYAERQILKALPKMAKAATSPELKAGFEQHHTETEGHVERLERVFELLGKTPRGKTCDAILGILDEGKSIMDEFKGTQALDAGLAAAAQAVEHYEIARYGTLRSWAKQLGMTEAADLFGQTLAEEEATDKKLTQLATTVVNKKAA